MPESYDLVFTVASSSTKPNVTLPRRVLKGYCALKSAPDPHRVTPESSKRILNLLAEYRKFGTGYALKKNRMGALVQGLRQVPCEHGHTKTWQVDESACKASGNPPIGKLDLQALRKAYRVHLAHLGFATIRSRSNTAANISDLAETFWYGRGNVTAAPVLIHTILVVGLSLGLRYDEIKKFKVENVSVGSGGCTLTLLESISNSTVHRTYQFRV